MILKRQTLDARLETHTFTPMQLIFLNSRVNGARYDGESLPVQRRLWPRSTFLRRRLAELAALKVREFGDWENGHGL